jgi:hypothetical protein
MLGGTTGGSAGLQGKRFTVNGTLNIRGQSTTISIQAVAAGNSYTVTFGQSSTPYPVSILLGFEGTTPTVSGNTIVFSGPTIAGFYSEPGIALLTMSSATLSLTLSSVATGATVTAMVVFQGPSGTIQGTLNGSVVGPIQ